MHPRLAASNTNDFEYLPLCCTSNLENELITPSFFDTTALILTNTAVCLLASISNNQLGGVVYKCMDYSAHFF
ncbi:MAG: hypothetical protein FOGNACKC_02253 [Anaerolineae bacterium]|nr:hypothetical protein [Anaerolineae bacterium]